MNTGKRRDIFGAQAFGELVGFLSIGDGNDIRTVPLNLLDQFVEVRACG
jgi:hypothetical protein